MDIRELGADLAAQSNLAVGATFIGAHGMGSREGEHMHETHSYQVVGVLAPTGTVVDRIVLTDVASVWAVHADQHDIKDVARIASTLFVAGQAIPIRMKNGMTVQRISTVAFSWKFAALWPTDLRCMITE